MTKQWTSDLETNNPAQETLGEHVKARRRTEGRKAMPDLCAATLGLLA